MPSIAVQVREELVRRRAKVSVAVFWGRERYVSILWRYLERNLLVNAGIVDELLLITHNRDGEEGAAGARAILDGAVTKCVDVETVLWTGRFGAGVPVPMGALRSVTTCGGCEHVQYGPPPPHTLSPARYPGVVREEKFCNQPYGCAFDEIMTDPAAIYIKLDDDIVFIKDGSFEHLVWQVGTW